MKAKERMFKRFTFSHAVLSTALLLLGSCAQDELKQAPATEEARIIPITLEKITADLDTEQMRALNFEMGEDVNGRIVPLHDLPDGSEVNVHTIVTTQGSGPHGAKTLKWRYSKAKNGKKAQLILTRGQIDIVDLGSSGDRTFVPGATKWYVMAMFGSGYLTGGTNSHPPKQINVENPTTVLTGVDNTNPKGGKLALNVPFAIPWTRLTIKEEPAGYVFGEARVKFRPLGSVIGYQIRNNTGSDLSPTSMLVHTNVFTHSGVFDVYNPTEGQYPYYTETQNCASAMNYTFDPNTPPGTIPNGGVSKYRYYAWVMPRTSMIVTNPSIKVWIPGVAPTGASAGTTSTSNLFNYWESNTVTTAPQMHKAHTLEAKMTHYANIRMPLEMVAEYNLVGGGEQVVYPVSDALSAQSMPLRFANKDASGGDVADPFAKDASALYNRYALKGLAHPQYNSTNMNIMEQQITDVDGSTITLKDKYYIPTVEDWCSALVSHKATNNEYFTEAKITFEESPTNPDFNKLFKIDAVRFGGEDTPLRFTASCTYTNPISDGNNKVVYGLRFMRPSDDAIRQGRLQPAKLNWWRKNQAGVNEKQTYCYPFIPDNRFVCAYRYTEEAVGSNEWRLRVESVYLGIDGYNAISGDKTAENLATQWNTLTSGRPMVTRVFSRPGSFTPFSNNPFKPNNTYYTDGENWGKAYAPASRTKIGRQASYFAEDGTFSLPQAFISISTGTNMEYPGTIRLFRR